jgi:hypothetical protein
MSLYPRKRTFLSAVSMSALCQKRTLCSAATDRACTVEFSPVGGEGCKAAKGPNTSNCPIWPAWRRQKSASRSGSIKEHTCLAAPLCNVQGPFRIMVAIGFDLREVQSSLQSSFTKQNGEQQ